MQQAQRTLTLLWYVLLAAQALYVAVAASGIGGTRSAGFARDVPLFAPALGVIAFASVIVARLAWRRLHARADALREPGAIAQARFTAALVTWLIEESVAIYGLVLALLGYPAGTWAVFSALALAAFLTHRPSVLAERLGPTPPGGA